MFSVVFPGQGSQIVGMAKEFHDNFNYVKDYFVEADDLLQKNLSNIILEGPTQKLNETENTQPAIFLVSYSIFNVIERETNFKIKNAKFFAGHSLGEYSALCCANSLSFQKTIELLKFRGKAMQDAVPNGEGGMLAILGSKIEEINNLIKENKDKFECYIANDNSIGQVVVSGSNKSLDDFSLQLSKNKIKFIKLPVSAPFHCPLMKKATNEMTDRIMDAKFHSPSIDIVSNVTAEPHNNSDDIKRLLVEQIEKPVRWRESVNNMIESGVEHFIEIGPGKVLTGLIKRINRNVKVNQVNNLKEVNNLINA